MTASPTSSGVDAPALSQEPTQLSEILSAFTFALDLTEGALPGHTLRSCLLGMRLAQAIGLAHPQRAGLFYALQLKDIGCSSNAARMTALVGGDDRVLKNAVKLTDWSRPHRPNPHAFRLLWQQVLPTSSLPRRLARLGTLARRQRANNREMIALRCERGAQIVAHLDLGPAVSQAVRHLDEHWDGSGYPDGLIGEGIPLLSRICSLAQNLDVFATAYGPERALEIVRSRRRSWFDPELIWAADSLQEERLLWSHCLPTDDAEETRRAVLDLDPGGPRSPVSANRMDRICEAFAEVVDAKSPFTFRHSLGVTEVATEIAAQLGMTAEQCSTVRRASLLHDLGKLNVPNSILDKQGKLTEAEWIVVRRHPEISGSILSRVPAFRGLAKLAAEHHERLDGSGYPRRLTARDLSLESRVVAIADCYAAMAEQRPYRPAIEPARVLEILAADAGSRLDPTCFDALQAAAARWDGALPTSSNGPVLCDARPVCDPVASSAERLYPQARAQAHHLMSRQF